MATLPARSAINTRLRSIRANPPFPWRQRAPLGLLGLAVAWSVLTDFRSARPIPSDVEGVLQVDVSLIRALNADLTRQALVVGLMHFALSTGHYVIAEGIETEEELQVLRSLGVELAV